MSKRILVLCQNYPSVKNPFSQTFIHYRLKEYVKDYAVEVLSFAAKEDYVYEGIQVFSEKSIKEKLQSQTYDAVISHAPNIRNHQRFLLSHLLRLKKIMFVFHGYEVIDIVSRVYARPTLYEYGHSIPFLSRIYHKIKLPITRVFLKFIQTIAKCHFVFVSNSLLKEVREDVKSSAFVSGVNTFIVNNPINPKFHEERFSSFKKHDFVCIRPFNDPKYGVDIFIKLAEKHPQYEFHLFGNGDLPKMEKLPENLTVFKKFISSNEMPKHLKNYKAAILPTRWDSQGVLACEIAAQGMPLITSDLDVCKEMLNAYKNVHLINNSEFHNLNLDSIELKADWNPENFYSHQKTTHIEMKVLENLLTLNEGNV